jgi:hypothetical protein
MYLPTPFRSRTAGWFASVTREGYQNGYWRRPRLTRWGAAWASHRQAWWLNRKDASKPRSLDWVAVAGWTAVALMGVAILALSGPVACAVAVTCWVALYLLGRGR